MIKDISNPKLAHMHPLFGFLKTHVQYFKLLNFMQDWRNFTNFSFIQPKPFNQLHPDRIRSDQTPYRKVHGIDKKNTTFSDIP